jgi:putative peptidoglycan lipid II flippase
VQMIALAAVLDDKHSLRQAPVRLAHPAVRELLVVLGPRMASISLDQVNFMVGSFLASFLGAGCVSYLGYALRVIGAIRRSVLQPLGRVLVPLVARHAARGEYEIIRKLVVNIVRLAGFLLIPAIAFVAGFRADILTLVLQRGAFSAASTGHTGRALLCYSLGTVAYVLNPVLVATFFCLQDSRSPLKVAAVIVILHTVLACVMMKLFGYAGIALAGALAACMASVLLWHRLQKRVGGLDAAGVLSSLGRSLLAALGMLAVGMVAGKVVAGTVIGHPISRLVFSALAATAAYALLQFLLNRQVCRQVIGFLRSKDVGLAAIEPDR